MRALVLALVVAASSVAHADEVTDPILLEAQALYDEGIQLYAAGRHAEAARKFARSYELSKAPALLWNLAQAHRLAGDCAAAHDAYRAYLRADPAAENAGDARAHLVETKRCADERAATDPRPADVVDPPPTAARPPLRPSDGPEQTDPGRGKRVAGIVTGVAGVALVATGVVLGLRASSAAADLEARYATPGVWDADAAALEAAGERDETLGIVFTSVGAAAIATGVVLYVLGSSSGPGEGSAATVTPTAGGVAFGWSRRF